MRHLDLLARLAQPAEGKIVLLVLDGVGDVRSEAQPRTALDLARKPHLDALAARSALGRLVPVAPGVTPGSGPGHLALFGYDPTSPEADIGRGVLEALGLGLEVGPGDVALRGNFATADADGRLTDRRAGRIPTAEGQRVCALLQKALASVTDLDVMVAPGESHRFVLLLRGEDLSADLADTDPQRTGVPPLVVRALSPAAESTARRLARVVEAMEAAVAGEPMANRVLLRGASGLPRLPSMRDLYRLRCGAFAGYPLYRGVASICGMEVVACGKSVEETFGAAAAAWDRFDYFFVHLKPTDAAGEDGDVLAKARAIEAADAALPRLLERKPAVLAVTGDHSTPAPLRSHSWHPVPVLLHSDRCFADDCVEFSEAAAVHGHLGTFPTRELMGLLLANAGRLKKYGA